MNEEKTTFIILHLCKLVAVQRVFQVPKKMHLFILRTVLSRCIVVLRVVSMRLHMYTHMMCSYEGKSSSH